MPAYPGPSNGVPGPYSKFAGKYNIVQRTQQWGHAKSRGREA